MFKTKEVLAIIGYTRDGLQRMLREGTFPPPAEVLIIKNVTYNFWTKAQLLSWVLDRMAQPSKLDEALKRLRA